MAERISESEFAVMEALWRRSPLTAQDVAREVAKPNDWSLQTVKTLLGRLVSKGVVSHQEDGRRYLYSPIVGREEHAARESRRLVDRLFGGRISPLVAHLAERDALSDADIAEIEALLKELKA